MLQGIGEPEVSVTFRLRQVVSDGRGLGAAVGGVGGVGAVVDGAGVGATQLPQLPQVELTQLHQLLTHSAFGSVHTPLPHHTPCDVEQLLRADASVAEVSMHTAVEASTHIQGIRSATILMGRNRGRVVHFPFIYPRLREKPSRESIRAIDSQA